MNSHATFVIRGGRELKGEIEVKGAKNAALKILAAAVLSREPCVIKNLPDIEDVQRMEELLRSIGVKISKTKQNTTIETSEVQAGPLDRSLVESIRASILLAGPLLARHGEVIMPHPGGDKIGQRPIDIFLDGFKALGVTVEVRDRSYRLTTNKLVAAHIRSYLIELRPARSLSSASSPTAKSKSRDATQVIWKVCSGILRKLVR